MQNLSQRYDFGRDQHDVPQRVPMKNKHLKRSGAKEGGSDCLRCWTADKRMRQQRQEPPKVWVSALGGESRKLAY